MSSETFDQLTSRVQRHLFGDDVTEMLPVFDQDDLDPNHRTLLKSLFWAKKIFEVLEGP